MRRLICSMGLSLDGYIVGPDGGFAWSAPDEEVFRFATDQVRGLGVHLLGRRLYETMRYWETADQDPALSDLEPGRALMGRIAGGKKGLTAVDLALPEGEVPERADPGRADPGRAEEAERAPSQLAGS